MKHILFIALSLTLTGCPRARPVEPWEQFLHRNDWPGLQKELSQGLNVNAVDERGNNILFHAISMGKLSIADHLIEKGACIECKDSNGDPIYEMNLHYAIPPASKKWLEDKRKLRAK